MKHKRKGLMLRDQRGVSIIAVIIYVAIALLVLVAFLGLDSITKGWKSGRTADYYNELQSVYSNFQMVKDKTKITYGGVIVDLEPKFSQTFKSPPVNAYMRTDSYVLNGERPLTAGGGDVTLPANTASIPTTLLNHRLYGINSTGTPTLYETGVYKAPTSLTPAGYTIYDSLNVAIKMNGNSVVSAGSKISDPTPNGMPYLNSLNSVDIEDIEKHLFLGLMNGTKTQLGRHLISKDTTGLTQKPLVVNDVTNDHIYNYPDTFSIRPILTLAFGDEKTRYATSSVPDSWFTLTPINISAFANTSDLENNRFLDNSKFRLYYVSKVASRENAAKIVKRAIANGTVTAADEDAMMEIYDAATETVVKDGIISIPLTEDNAVFSESSDYKYYLFGLYD